MSATYFPTRQVYLSTANYYTNISQHGTIYSSPTVTLMIINIKFIELLGVTPKIVFNQCQQEI